MLNKRDHLSLKEITTPSLTLHVHIFNIAKGSLKIADQHICINRTTGKKKICPLFFKGVINFLQFSTFYNKM